MKKLVLVLFVLIMTLVAFSGCGGDTIQGVDDEVTSYFINILNR